MVKRASGRVAHARAEVGNGGDPHPECRAPPLLGNDFNRAFMLSGMPRVLLSLWNVDDQATLALMTRFYELWNPKDVSKRMRASKALTEAQNFVRDHPDHPEWKHPYYWAAWILWGVPE